ncbi:diacylglycerol kinase family protein [Streptococcus parauberis KCTC 11537]|nr:diacylglycerol kinase family protein [Streptococcus parauberis KCTC 11537]
MISSLTLGLLADIAANVTSESKRKYGPLAFLKDSLRILRRNRTYSIIINEQNSTYIADLKFLLITMTNTIAGMPSFSPDAAIDDGHFQVYTMKKVSFLNFSVIGMTFTKEIFQELEKFTILVLTNSVLNQLILIDHLIHGHELTAIKVVVFLSD